MDRIEATRSFRNLNHGQASPISMIGIKAAQHVVITLHKIESRLDNSPCFPERVSLNLRASLRNPVDEVCENVRFDKHFEQEILIYGDDRHRDR